MKCKGHLTLLLVPDKKILFIEAQCSYLLWVCELNPCIISHIVVGTCVEMLLPSTKKYYSHKVARPNRKQNICGEGGLPPGFAIVKFPCRGY